MAKLSKTMRHWYKILRHVLLEALSKSVTRTEFVAYKKVVQDAGPAEFLRRARLRLDVACAPSFGPVDPPFCARHNGASHKDLSGGRA
jgi:hypothetical protein